MATIKSHTDLGQSKKLAKILPITSIDFAWCIFSNGSTKLLRMDDWEVSENAKSNVEIIPCWSLAALLNVLPEPELTQGSDRRWMLRIWDKKRLPLTIGGHVDPVEACYEMIIKLHEKKIL